jgi:hypothetical protein
VRLGVGEYFEDFGQKGAVVGVSPFTFRIFVGEAPEAFALDEKALVDGWCPGPCPRRQIERRVGVVLHPGGEGNRGRGFWVDAFCEIWVKRNFTARITKITGEERP